MTDKIVVLVTVGNLREARKIAQGLVAGKLAACVNISTPVESTYRWLGKIKNARERLLVIKTTRALFPELQAAIRKFHSYTTPEIICLPIIDGAADYLDWLGQAVKSPAGGAEPPA